MSLGRKVGIFGEGRAGFFTFRSAAILGITTEIWFLLNNLIYEAGWRGVYGLLRIDTKAVAAVTFARTVGLGQKIAVIALLFLLLRLLQIYRREKTAHSLVAAFKEGLLTEHEFRQKELDLKSDEILERLRLLASAGAVHSRGTSEILYVVKESYRRERLREALLEAKANGAIDEQTYRTNVARLAK